MGQDLRHHVRILTRAEADGRADGHPAGATRVAHARRCRATCLSENFSACGATVHGNEGTPTQVSHVIAREQRAGAPPGVKTRPACDASLADGRAGVTCNQLEVRAQKESRPLQAAEGSGGNAHKGRRAAKQSLRCAAQTHTAPHCSDCSLAATMTAAVPAALWNST